MKLFTYHGVVIQADRNSHSRIKGSEASWDGVSSFCSILLLWPTSPQHLDTVKLKHIYKKSTVPVINATLRLFLSLFLPVYFLTVCAVIPQYRKEGKVRFTTVDSGDEHCSNTVFVALDGTDHQSSPNVFVRAVSLFSQLYANIFPGSVVLGTWGIHEESL